MHILVTGAAGLVGSQVVRELSEHGHQVRALDNRILPDELRSLPNVIPVYLDITDPLALLNNTAGIDAIAHTAAIPNLNKTSHAELLRINVVGTQNVLDAAQAYNISKVVVTSSIGAMGISFPTHPIFPDYLPLDIQHPRRPQDVYGLSKLVNEESAAAWTRRTGKTTVVLRPPGVMNLERAKVNGWLTRGLTHRTESFMQEFWAYVDGRDLGRCFRLALETELSGHHVFFAMADDVFAELPAREMIAKFLPDLLPFADKLTGQSLYDLTPARDLLGFTAEYTWRRVLQQE